MTIKKIWIVVSLAGALVLAVSAVASAYPVQGTWKGNESHWWDGRTWLPYKSADKARYSMRFSVKPGKVVSVRFTRYNYTCQATGERISVRAVFNSARIYARGGSYKFRGTVIARVSGKRYRADATGTFSSSRKVSGTVKQGLSGCGNSDLTRWSASGPKPKPKIKPGPKPPPRPCTPYVWVDDSGWPHILYRC